MAVDVLALGPGLEVVGVAPAARVDEDGALASGRVEEEPLHVGVAVPGLLRQRAHIWNIKVSHVFLPAAKPSGPGAV